jgi:anti-sigma regulatory factor (Ser/Thr protein kinase)
MLSDIDEPLRADLTASRRARQIVHENLHATDCEHDAALIATELVTNAVRYGAEPIRLRVGCLDNVVRVEVVDARPGMQPTRSDSRGLSIVARLARAWGISNHRGSKVVWAEIDCHATAPS